MTKGKITPTTLNEWFYNKDGLYENNVTFDGSGFNTALVKDFTNVMARPGLACGRELLRLGLCR